MTISSTNVLLCLQQLLKFNYTAVVISEECKNDNYNEM